MPRIVPAIGSLKQYLEVLLCTPQRCRPECCPACGLAGLWSHGHYDRKADREAGVLNPIPVRRYLCGKRGGCGKSCSRLPSCIAPKRWYLWRVQHAALLWLLGGASLAACAKGWANRPSSCTVRRWWRWLKSHHDEFAFHLREREPEWGRAVQWRDFWQRSLHARPLAELMAYLDGRGLIVP